MMRGTESKGGGVQGIEYDFVVLVIMDKINFLSFSTKHLSVICRPTGKVLQFWRKMALPRIYNY